MWVGIAFPGQGVGGPGRTNNYFEKTDETNWKIWFLQGREGEKETERETKRLKMARCVCVCVIGRGSMYKTRKDKR